MGRTKAYMIVETCGSFYDANETIVRDVAYRVRRSAEKELLEDGWVKNFNIIKGDVVYEPKSLNRGSKVCDYWYAEIRELIIKE